jgi:hypothetical protein
MRKDGKEKRKSSAVERCSQGGTSRDGKRRTTVNQVKIHTLLDSWFVAALPSLLNHFPGIPLTLSKTPKVVVVVVIINNNT